MSILEKILENIRTFSFLLYCSIYFENVLLEFTKNRFKIKNEKRIFYTRIKNKIEYEKMNKGFFILSSSTPTKKEKRKKCVFETKTDFFLQKKTINYSKETIQI